MKLFKTSKIPFSRRIALCTILLTLFPLLLNGVYNTSYLYKQLNKVMLENTQTQVETVKRALNTNVEIVKLLQYSLMGNKQIGDMLDNDNVTHFELSSMQEYLHEDVSLNYGWSMGIIKSVYIFKDENHYINITKNSYDALEYKQNASVYKKNSDKYGTIISIDEIENDIFHIGAPILNQNDKQIGYVVMAVDINQFSNVFKDMKTDYFMLHMTNAEDVVIASTQKGQVGKLLPDAHENLIKKDIIWGGRLAIVTEVDSKSIIASVWHAVITNLLILITFAVVATFISIFLSKGMVRVFKNLIVNINEFSKENLDIRVPDYQDADFDAIGQAFNSMADSIAALIHDTYQKELLIKEMQIQALQSQINPHFLFNTLTTIALIAKKGEKELAHKMISALSKLLRERILTGRNDTSTLKNELHITDYYIYIQQVRFGKRLNYVLNKSENASDDFVMPKLMLQPLVENAFCHGIEKKVDGGTICVNIDYKDGYLTVEISDDGVGFEPEQIQTEENEHNHISLTNIRKRLNLYYGNDFEFDIQSKINEGTRVLIKIPTSKNS